MPRPRPRPRPGVAPAAVLLLLLLALATTAAAAEIRRPATTAAAAEILHPATTAAAAEIRRPATTAFGRSSWLGNLTLLGSASMIPGKIAFSLTTNASDAGRALFSEPVRLLLPPPNPRAARPQASFSTRFTFRIVPSPTYGDGLAFIFTSSSTFVGAADGFLGLYVSTLTSGVSTLAVEFDTYHDPALGDTDGNHVGIDTGSIYSVASASPGLDLKAGGVPITAWVQYDAMRRRLRAWVSHSSSRRHINPALSIITDLSVLVNETMYVGFSASNNKGSALHMVQSWSFRTYWPRNTQSVTLAASPPPLPPITPARGQQQHHHRFVGWLVGSLTFLVILALLYLLCIHPHRKIKCRSIQLAERHSMLPKDFGRSA